MEGLNVSDANLVVTVHPSKAKDVSQAIYGELSSLLFKFHEKFDGVLLAYEAYAENNLAKILAGLHPCFQVRLKARLLLFNPKPDMLLEGKVVKLGEQSIHIVVLGFSSATIIEEDIRNEFKFKVANGKEVFASTFREHHKIKVGTIIRFVVKSFDEENLHILGSLLPDHTGNIKWLDPKLEDLADSTRKRKESKGPIEMPEHDGAQVVEETSQHSSKKEKRKKHSKRQRSSDS